MWLILKRHLEVFGRCQLEERIWDIFQHNVWNIRQRNPSNREKKATNEGTVVWAASLYIIILFAALSFPTKDKCQIKEPAQPREKISQLVTFKRWLRMVCRSVDRRRSSYIIFKTLKLNIELKDITELSGVN